MPPDPLQQIEDFREAVELLGGQNAVASALGVHRRTIGRLCLGQIPLHDGFLREIAALLLTASARMRELERRLTPAMTGNLTPEQRAPRNLGNRFDRKD